MGTSLLQFGSAGKSRGLDGTGGGPLALGVACLRLFLVGVLAIPACERRGAEPAAESTTPAQAVEPAQVRTLAEFGRPNLPTVVLPNIPHVDQKPDFCGEADVEMVLRKEGIPLDQDDVFALSGMDPARGMGATTRELSAALTRLGFDVGPVWLSARPSSVAQDLADVFRALHADLAQGVASIMCTHFSDRPNTTEHFRLVVGYDQATDEIVYHDPAVANGAYLRMARDRFLELALLKYRPDQWTVIRMRLAGHPRMPEHPPSKGLFSQAAYAQHVMTLKPKLGPAFTVVIEPPFVVVSDEEPRRVRERAANTVRWAARMLKKDFFSSDPDRILTIWLLRGADSYNDRVRRDFPNSPETPYGFYSAHYDALVMNIATGGGTLVHEMVHPFVEANLRGCPAWLNEGLGSLFEQSAERDGHIVGLTNWRLAGLQRAIRRGAVPDFSTLLHTTDEAFYDRDPGTNYAQSRYLLYYLQQHALLNEFWLRYREERTLDPSGYTTLTKVLGTHDMAAFKRQWEAETLALTFP